MRLADLIDDIDVVESAMIVLNSVLRSFSASPGGSAALKDDVMQLITCELGFDGSR
jgi:hypothetical protein